MANYTPSDELQAARVAWRERVEAERQRERERQEEADDEEVAVLVPLTESSDAEELAVYKDSTRALLDRGFLFKHVYFTNKSSTREMRGAIYKCNRSSREATSCTSVLSRNLRHLISRSSALTSTPSGISIASGCVGGCRSLGTAM